MRGWNARMAAGGRDGYHCVEVPLLSDTGDSNDRAPRFCEPTYERQDECKLSIRIFPILTAFVDEKCESVFAILVQ